MILQTGLFFDHSDRTVDRANYGIDTGNTINPLERKLGAWIDEFNIILDLLKQLIPEDYLDLDWTFHESNHKVSAQPVPKFEEAAAQ